MSQTPARYRRRIFLINKPFQFKFSVYVCSWLMAVSLIYPWLVYQLFNWFIRTLAVDPNGPMLPQLLQFRGQMVWLLVAMQIAFVFMIFLISIFMSHRIAGPVFKLRQFMGNARNGNWQLLKFRKADHFPEMADDFNALAESIRDSASAATAHIEKALPQVQNDAVQAELRSAVAALKHLGVQ